jgi:integrase
VIRATGSDNPERKYLARPIISGSKKRVYGRTKTEVERQVVALRERERRRRLGIADPLDRPTDLTYDALCDKVLVAYLHTEQSKRTLAANLKRSRDKFGRLLVRELTAEAVQTWLASLALAETTRRSSLKAMRQALQQAVEWDYAHRNVASSVEMPKEPRYSVHPFASWAEVLSVSESMTRTADKALVRFACATGLRPQEWQAIRWLDIKPSERTLRVSRALRNGKVEDRGKTDAALRTVHLTARALQALDLLPVPIRREQLVFPAERGGPINLHNWRAREWADALSAASLTYRPPSGMRDTFATLNLADGASIEWIAKEMGHTEVTTTLRHYAEWLPRADAAILARLDAAHVAETGPETDQLAEAAE